MNEDEVKRKLAAPHPEKEMVKKGLGLTEDGYRDYYLMIWRKTGYLPPHIRGASQTGALRGARP